MNCKYKWFIAPVTAQECSNGIYACRCFNKHLRIPTLKAFPQLKKKTLVARVADLMNFVKL